MRRPLLLATSLVALAPGLAHADTRNGAAEDPSVLQARDDFVHGATFVKNLQYADALIAFEHSAKLRPHAATTYNIGVCQRAMGRYTLARSTFEASLEQDRAADGSQLSETLRSETAAFVNEIDHVLANLTITLNPADAAIAVDGRPLERASDAGAMPTLVAGTRPAGKGEPPPSPTFDVVVDPGAHVLTLSRKGFADVVINRSLLPGSKTGLKLELDRLPASFHFASDRDGATVAIDAVDVGVVPVDVTRPAGRYLVAVRKSGFVAYESQVVAQPGERIDLMANLKQERPAITTRWWFWTAAVVVVAGAAVGTYYATRPPNALRSMAEGSAGRCRQGEPALLFRPWGSPGLRGARLFTFARSAAAAWRGAVRRRH